MSNGEDADGPEGDEAGDPGEAAADEASADTGADAEPTDAGDEAEPADTGTDAEPAGTGDEAEPAEAGEAGELSTETLDSRLDDAAEAIEAAETEADLDAVEEDLDSVQAALEAADRPDEDEEDAEDGEDAEDPLAAVEDRLGDLREDLEAARGPYAEDVVAELSAAESTVTDSEWTEDGEAAVVEAVETAAAAAGEALDRSFDVDDSDVESLAASIVSVRGAVDGADLDPDEDADTLEALVEAAETLTDDLEAAEVWSDLTIREQLDVQGFYDVLTPENRKDFPPEWNAIKVYATAGEAEPILTALERYESDFMEENILDALERFAPPEAVEPLLERAERRDKHAIRVLGRIGDDRACEPIEELLGGGDVQLDSVCLRALGAIGSEDSTQAVADRLVADEATVRSVAARSLGLIGDTRAIDPLGDVLAEDDANEVRASAAWALRQIGTEEALETAAEYADDRSYIVQAEAEKAAGA